MSRWSRWCRIAALLAPFVPGAALASTDGQASSWALNEFGGTPAERQVLYAGRPGIFLATSPAALQFIAWRRLHGQTVPTAAGEALTIPCCTFAGSGASDVVAAWLAARRTIPGVPPQEGFVPVELPGPDYTSQPNCLDDAFRNATATLTTRAAAHGADTPELRAWVAAQDAVFLACAKPVAALPPLPDGAPDWLQADHRYQAAALLFYSTRYADAAAAFGQIAADAASPWREIAPYLRVRALLRQGLASKTATDFTAAREAALALPAGTPFQASGARLAGMAQLRGDPAAAGARLTAALGAETLTEQAASDLKDLLSLAGSSAVPDLVDWINTFKTGAAAPPVMPDDRGTPLDRARAAEGRRTAALSHAKERYTASRDAAWLIAVLALMQPDEAADGSVLADAAAIGPEAPAHLTVLYHRVRLTIATADPAPLRAQLDAALARDDLSATTRNLLLAERLQLAEDLPAFARFALRPLTCTKEADGCRSGDWGYFGHGGGLFDKDDDTATPGATLGLGDDARYLIDRMALIPRMALAAEAALPAPIRMDLALTNFARAVLLRNDAAVDRMAALLQTLLPAMAADFAAIPKARGADRLFAQYFVFAKIPGLRADLVDYVRPTGTPADFGGRWPDWIGLAKPDPDSIPPSPVLYDNAGYQVVDVPAGTDLGNNRRRIPDPVCTGMCGAGGFVPAAPAFLAPTAVAATTERRLLPPPGKYGDSTALPSARMEAFPNQDYEHPTKALPAPPGATILWEYILDHVSRRPRDPRAAEALHWLVHIGHYGQSHNHSGRRAFRLLKGRYGTTEWAKQNEFYYD